GASGEEQRKRAGLLYKSLEGFLEFLTNTPEWRDFLLVFQRAQSLGGTNWLKDLQELLGQASQKTVRTWFAFSLKMWSCLRATTERASAWG
ncbi:MAG: hypothetical protein HC883_05920, partial [Bdellovibrionaceae bacterium]|nr:hypothetical protein [Pseudobdellovibrionaceae bacterium]